MMEAQTSFLRQLRGTVTVFWESSPGDEIEKFLDAPCQMSLPIKAFSPKEISQIIQKINEHKAPGYGLITGKILRQLPMKAIVLLTVIYNRMLRLSYFPVT
jgi:hypothetical protein